MGWLAFSFAEGVVKPIDAFPVLNRRDKDWELWSWENFPEAYVRSSEAKVHYRDAVLVVAYFCAKNPSPLASDFATPPTFPDLFYVNVDAEAD